MSYTHFTLNERKYLQELLSQGYSIRKIAAALGRAPSSVSREIRRNRSKFPPRKKSDNIYQYHHWRAHTLYIMRRRGLHRHVLLPDTAQWDFVIDGFQHFWSPEEICGRWHLVYPEKRRLCMATLYRYIKAGKFPKITVKTHLRRRGKRKISSNSCFQTIQADRLITQWPQEIVARIRIGDWEGDTIYGAVGKGFLVSLIDRKSRYLRLGLLRTRSATETRAVIRRLLRGLPVKSLSFDNGSEFAEFRGIEEDLSTLVYFAEPHKPWQRGSNENINDLVRFFFPKGFDFTSITDEDVQFVEDLINRRPRKCLGWKSPAEVFAASSVALA